MTTGNRIKVGFGTVIYLPAGAELSDTEKTALRGFSPLYDAELRDHPRLRRAIDVSLPSMNNYGVFHWSNGKDLIDLDRTVASGELEDSDFDDALWAYATGGYCDTCGKTIPVMAVDGGAAFFRGNLGERIQNHKLYNSCPFCHGESIPLAVEILSQDAVRAKDAASPGDPKG